MVVVVAVLPRAFHEVHQERRELNEHLDFAHLVRDDLRPGQRDRDVRPSRARDSVRREHAIDHLIQAKSLLDRKVATGKHRDDHLLHGRDKLFFGNLFVREQLAARGRLDNPGRPNLELDHQGVIHFQQPCHVVREVGQVLAQANGSALYLDLELAQRAPARGVRTDGLLGVGGLACKLLGQSEVLKVELVRRELQRHHVALLRRVVRRDAQTSAETLRTMPLQEPPEGAVLAVQVRRVRREGVHGQVVVERVVRDLLLGLEATHDAAPEQVASHLADPGQLHRGAVERSCVRVLPNRQEGQALSVVDDLVQLRLALTLSAVAHVAVVDRVQHVLLLVAAVLKELLALFLVRKGFIASRE